MLLQSRVTLFLLVLTIVSVSILTYLYSGGASSKSLVGAALKSKTELDYAFEVRDERQLVGEADNVFLGRVVEQVGSERLLAPVAGAPDDVRTQFAVEVKKNIKGNLSDVVRVSQDGGNVEYVADRGPEKGKRKKELVLLEDDPLLKPGRKHVFVTNYDQEKNYHQISTPGYGDVPVDNKEKEKVLIKKFEKAKTEQIDPTKTKVSSKDIPAEYLEEDTAHEHP